MNKHVSEQLSPLAESIHTLPGADVGTLIWLSIPNGDVDSHVDLSLSIVTLALSITTNAVTTMMIAYKLWYVAVGGIH